MKATRPFDIHTARGIAHQAYTELTLNRIEAERKRQDAIDQVKAVLEHTTVMVG
jgi:hypothetical protein